MLYWKANFQIPNSGVQTSEVFAFAVLENEKINVTFYGDENKNNLLFFKEYDLENEEQEIYDYLLSLEDFAEYTKA